MLSLILGIVTIAIGCPPIAPFAWFIGRRTVREIDASGGTLGGRSQAMVGYVIGMVVSIITIVAVVVVGIIAIIAATTSTTT